MFVILKEEALIQILSDSDLMKKKKNQGFVGKIFTFC